MLRCIKRGNSMGVCSLMQTYVYKGRVEGAFFDLNGNPTKMVRKVLEGTQRSNIAKKQREGKRADYPDCSKRWSQDEGAPLVVGSVSSIHLLSCFLLCHEHL
jgi:hypothetical protein